MANSCSYKFIALSKLILDVLLGLFAAICIRQSLNQKRKLYAMIKVFH